MQEQVNNPGNMPNNPSSAVEEGKTIAIIAYITVIGLIIALVLNAEKKNSFAKFHIRQSLGIMLTGLVVSFISWVPILGWIVWALAAVLLLVLWISGFLAALSGKEKVVPVLGHRYAEWFKTI